MLFRQPHLSDSKKNHPHIFNSFLLSPERLETGFGGERESWDDKSRIPRSTCEHSMLAATFVASAAHGFGEMENSTIALAGSCRISIQDREAPSWQLWQQTEGTSCWFSREEANPLEEGAYSCHGWQSPWPHPVSVLIDFGNSQHRPAEIITSDNQELRNHFKRKCGTVSRASPFRFKVHYGMDVIKAISLVNWLFAFPQTSLSLPPSVLVKKTKILTRAAVLGGCSVFLL